MAAEFALRAKIASLRIVTPGRDLRIGLEGLEAKTLPIEAFDKGQTLDVSRQSRKFILREISHWPGLWRLRGASNDGGIYPGFDEDGIPLPLPRLALGERGRVRGIPG